MLFVVIRKGDVGTIISIDLEAKAVAVQFDRRSVTYDRADLNEITLAWAVTIHKRQGSEYPLVIMHDVHAALCDAESESVVCEADACEEAGDFG